MTIASNSLLTIHISQPSVDSTCSLVFGLNVEWQKNVSPDTCSGLVIRQTTLQVSVQIYTTHVHMWLETHHRQTNTHTRRPINKTVVLLGQVESSLADTSPVHRDQSVAHGNPCVCFPFVPRSDYPAVDPIQNCFCKTHNLTQYHCCVFYSVTQMSVGGKEGLWGGGVIPIKTQLQLVLNERRNVLLDRPFQLGHLKVLEQARRFR